MPPYRQDLNSRIYRVSRKVILGPFKWPTTIFCLGAIWVLASIKLTIKITTRLTMKDL